MHSQSSKSSLFSINSSNKDFKNRQNNIFEQLDVAELNRKNTEKNESMETDNVQDNFTHKRKSFETKQFRGQESIFKKPEAPISRCLPVRNVPDFHKNPHKWTKYTLDDVKDEDMSERSNAFAAMSLLKELENRNDIKQNDELHDAEEKITFNKSVVIKNKTEDDDETLKHSFKSSKVIMPEYIVGQKIKKNKKDKSKRSGLSSKQLKLDHLFVEDNEEEG